MDQLNMKSSMVCANIWDVQSERKKSETAILHI